jgi:chromosome segregation ATPase
LREREKVADLQRQAREADGAVEQLRERIEAAVTEEERRAALAAAIEEADKADAALHNLRAVVARADSAVADAQERHSDAARAVTVATETHARLFEAAIEQGHPPGQDSSVRDARRAADDAADDLAVAKAAAATMRAKLGNAERRLSDTQKAVTSCAQNVVLAGLPKLLAEAQTMQVELESRRQVLSALSNFEDRRSEIDEFLEAPVFPYTSSGGRPEDHPAVVPWLEAIEALQTDADAPLPAN